MQLALPVGGPQLNGLMLQYWKAQQSFLGIFIFGNQVHIFGKLLIIFGNLSNKEFL